MAHFSEEGFEEDPELSVQIENPLSDDQNALLLEQLSVTSRDLLLEEAELDVLLCRGSTLRLCLLSVAGGNARLRAAATTQPEPDATAAAAAYRAKMAAHQGAAGQELEEKKAAVRSLREDLERALTAHREVQVLREEAERRRGDIAEKNRLLRKALGVQRNVRRDIQIQDQRFQAVVKRLCLQLSRTQEDHRRTLEKISVLRRKLDELKNRENVL